VVLDMLTEDFDHLYDNQKLLVAVNLGVDYTYTGNGKEIGAKLMEYFEQEILPIDLAKTDLNYLNLDQVFDSYITAHSDKLFRLRCLK
jgi:hypothetical protein